MRTLATLVHERVRLSPNDVAVRSRTEGVWRDQTWTALAERVEAIAAGLLSAPGGLRPGECVGILAETSGDWIALDHAALSVAAVTVPIYTSLPAPEVGYVHADTMIRPRRLAPHR
jgi:long-chain acyl-CoA synthetase